MIWLGWIGLGILFYILVCFFVVLYLGAVEYGKIDVLSIEERVFLRIVRSPLFLLFIPLCFMLFWLKKLTGQNRN